MKTMKFENGQSIFELVMAIAISALIVVAIVSLATLSIRNSGFSKNKALAATYVQQAAEWLRGQRGDDMTVFETGIVKAENVARCFNVLGWDSLNACPAGDKISGTPFTREVTFSQTDTVKNGSVITVYDADIVVSWSDAQGIHEVASATSFSDWRQR